MDINGFREAQSPWFFSQPPTEIIDNRNMSLMTVPQAKTLPTRDTRYPGWAAPMSDDSSASNDGSQHVALDGELFAVHAVVI
jgi:hypothetical protein